MGAHSHDRLISLSEPFPGVHLLARRPIADARGAFTRLFCRQRLAQLKIDAHVEQVNFSQSTFAGTWRGFHYQTGSSAETKIVSCVTGRIFDVVLDLRPGSPNHGETIGFELTAETMQAVVVPKGCAHGFLTLEPNCSVLYFVSAAYDPLLERGVRFDDPSIQVRWPQLPAVISERDRNHPDLDLARALH